MEKAREFQKNIYFCFIDYAKTFDCVDHNKLSMSSRDGIPDHLTCLLRNQYAGQEATVRTGHGTAGLPVHHQLPGFTQLMAIESVIPSNHLILCRALFLLPSIFASMSVFSWQNSISLCPASFCIPRPNLPVTPGISWLPTFAFQSPIMKRTYFLVLVLEGLVGLHRTIQLHFFSITDWGIDLDYCDIEWWFWSPPK